MNTRATRTAVLFAVLLICGPAALAADASEEKDTIVVESPTMKADEPMPINHTQHGWDFSPALTWKNLPEGTKELALVFEPRAGWFAEPKPFVHWVVYNIPAKAGGLPERLPRQAKPKAPEELAGLVQGHTGWGAPGYRGPLPVSGPAQEYSFKVYALDAGLNLKPGLDKAGLLEAIEGHVIGTGELAVICQRFGRGQRRSGRS